MALAILSGLGYSLTALTGRPHEIEYLQQLGASEVVDRAEYSQPAPPLAKERWAAAVDVAGGHTLANVCAAMRYQGVVAACGLAESMNFPANMAPFILRGIHLVGIDSVHAPTEQRLRAWRRLATDLNPSHLQCLLAQEISLSDVIDAAEQLLAGQIRGRVVVAVNPD